MQEFPINEFIIKIASRCNLNCTYCYEYNLGDMSWKKMSKIISDKTIDLIVDKVIAHCQKYDLDNVVISLHGGEPFLVGEDKFEKILKKFHKLENYNIEPSISTQTNATLVSDRFIEVIKKYNVQVSVSIDGNESHNSSRVFHNNKSSFQPVLNGITKLKNELGNLFGGVLAVIDIRNNPIEVYDFFKQLEIKSLDLILPDFSWSNLPIRPTKLNWATESELNDKNFIETVYGRWYAQVWNRWIEDKLNPPQIRFFENIIHNIVQGHGIFEVMSNDPITLVTINTNGGFEAVDTLKSLGNGYQDLNLDIENNTLEEVMSHKKYQLRQHTENQYSSKCLKCEYLKACWGGYFPHRIDKGEIRESIYCHDLQYIIEHIQNSIQIT